VPHPTIPRVPPPARRMQLVMRPPPTVAQVPQPETSRRLVPATALQPVPGAVPRPPGAPVGAPTLVVQQAAPMHMHGHVIRRGPDSRSWVPPPQPQPVWQPPTHGQMQPPPSQIHLQPPLSQATLQHPPSLLQAHQPPASQLQLQPPPSQAQLHAAPMCEPQADPMSATLQRQPKGAPPTTYGGHSQLIHAQTVPHTPARGQHQQLAPGASRKQVPVNVEVVASGSSAAPLLLPRSIANYVPPHCPNRVPTSANVEHLDPVAVYNLLKDGQCVLVDVRGDDRAAGLMEGAIHIPAIGAGSILGRIPELAQQWADEDLIIFTCQYSAHRAPQCANWYRQQAPPQQRVAILSGGFRGWEAVGLPVQSLADGESAQQADELAMRLGTQFVQGLPGQQGQAGRAGMQVAAGGEVAQAAVAPQTGRQPYVPPPCPNRVPTIAGVEHIDPMTVCDLLKENRCILVDLRGEDRASGLIEGAVHVKAIDTVPFVNKVPNLVQQWADHKLVIFTCQYSAHRAPQCANWYRQQTSPLQHVGILSGGFRGWEACGLPVQSLASAETAQAADEMAMQIGTQFVQSASVQEFQAQMASQQEEAAGQQPLQHFQEQLQQHGEQQHQLQQQQLQQMQLQHQMQQQLLQQQQHQMQHQLQQQQHLPQQMQEPASREAEAVQSAPPASSSQAGRQPYVPPHLPNTVPTIKDVEHVDPVTVQELVQSQKCILVDLRGEDRASGLIEGAVHEPAIDTVPFTTKVPLLVSKWANQSFVVFTCQYSAHRAPQCANWYRERADPRQRVGILSGGFRGWEAMGLPVQNPADGENAKAADEVAVNLGTKFVEGCLAGVPGGGFCMPTSQPAKPQPAAQAPQQPVAQPLVPQQRQAAGGGQRSYVPPHLPNTVPVIENVETLDPRAVLELLQSRSCLLVDLRGEDRAAGLIEGAVHEPAIDAVPFPTKVPRLVQQWADQALVIFTCQYSAHRAPQCANWYRQKASPQQRVAILSGGFRGWEATGLPVLSLASPEQGHAADEAAKQLGTQFAGGCVARVPGGGFSIPGK